MRMMGRTNLPVVISDDDDDSHYDYDNHRYGPPASQAVMMIIITMHPLHLKLGRTAHLKRVSKKR